METTKDELLLMMQRYDIGKKPLSVVLGWGATTVLRYLNGTEPNAEFARRITELSGNPREYALLLEKNKDKISEVAYRKSHQAVLREMHCNRSMEALQYLITLTDGDIAPYYAVVVLYYAQVCSLVLYGVPLFEEDVEFKKEIAKEEIGRFVYPRLYHQLKTCGIQINRTKVFTLSGKEQRCIKSVWKTLEGYSPNKVKSMLIKDRAMLRRNLKNQADRIPVALLKEQYDRVLKRMGVEEPGELIKEHFSTPSAK